MKLSGLLISITILITILIGRVYAYNGNDVINSVNQVRKTAHLQKLSESQTLDNSANNKAKDLCSKNYWYHGDWTSFFINAGYYYKDAGENLAYGYVNLEDLMSAWVNSPSHYSNIVGDYTETGAAVLNCSTYQGADNQTIVVNHFATPLHGTLIQSVTANNYGDLYKLLIKAIKLKPIDSWLIIQS